MMFSFDRKKQRSHLINIVYYSTDSDINDFVVLYWTQKLFCG